jgi:hypothetical protein
MHFLSAVDTVFGQDEVVHVAQAQRGPYGSRLRATAVASGRNLTDDTQPTPPLADKNGGPVVDPLQPFADARTNGAPYPR